MKKTLFAGLTVLEPGEGLATDNGAFVSADPQIEDRLLEIGAKTHRHTGLAGLSNPSGAPVASIVASGGALPSDLAISVGYTLEDSQGGETMLSPIAVVSTPGGLPEPPAAPSAQISHAAGQLAVNTYYYAASFVDGEGGETELGPAVSADRQPGFASGQIILTQLSFGMAAAGAAGWRLYRAIGGDSFDLLATGTADEFIDDGTQAVSCDVHPPAGEQNTTIGNSSLLVTLPSAVAGEMFINVYASVGGDFGGGSLLGQFPVASAGHIAVFRTLEFFDVSPPPVNLSIGGAHQIDPDTELLDWHWKRPVLASGALGSGVTGDVRLVEGTGQIYAVLLPSAVASGASEWVRIASAGGGSGSVGPQGPAGPQGPEGPAGPKGASGASGAIGLTGPQGPEGPAGPKGASGASGAIGLTGPEGQTGGIGPQGPIGPGNSWKPPVFGSASLGSGVLGDVKMVEQEGEIYGVLGASATVASGWVRLSSASSLEASATPGFVNPVQKLTIRGSGVAGVTIEKQSAGKALVTVTVPPVAGPQGATGASGASGAIGLTGPTGASGASGAIGLTGAAGQDGPGVFLFEGSSVFEKLNEALQQSIRRNKEKWSEVTEIGISNEAQKMGTITNLLGQVSVGEVILIYDRTAPTSKVSLRVTGITFNNLKNSQVFAVQVIESSGVTTFGKLGSELVLVMTLPPRDFGIVEALPTGPTLTKGDRCRFVADKTNGVIWDLVYDGEGEFPWKKIGGPPLYNEVTTQQGTTSATYANLTTEGPFVTTPLKGDYDVEIGAGLGSFTASVEVIMSYAIGGTGAADADGIKVFPGPSGGFHGSNRRRRKTGLAASAKLVAKYKTSGGEMLAYNRWIAIDPVRVG